jgi:hypothetical protein
MTKSAILLLTLSLLVAPGFAADPTAEPAVPQALSSLSCSAAEGAAPAVIPAELGSAIPLSNGPNCCTNFEHNCLRICGGSYASFTCDAEACTAFCYCG